MFTNSTPQMAAENTHFLAPELLRKTTGKKMDMDVIRNMQGFSEKILSDILNRASLLTRHMGRDIMDVSEISTIVEKDFDYSFGMRTHIKERELPTPEHIEKIAEISREK